MRLLRRRLTLQLTPLLDLLLIVIFAQYMEMRQQTVEAASVAAERVEAAEQERAAARRELERELADLQQMRRRLTEDEQRLVERARQAEEQRRVAGEVASEGCKRQRIIREARSRSSKAGWATRRRA